MNTHKTTSSDQVHILVVDDHPNTANTLARALAQLGPGVDVTSAVSGRDALEKVQNKGVDILFTDMIMPEMGGGEVFDQLKRINPSVKVLLASGYSMQGQAREIMNRGCDGFLQKPFTLEDISVRIRSLISRS